MVNTKSLPQTNFNSDSILDPSKWSVLVLTWALIANTFIGPEETQKVVNPQQVSQYLNNQSV